MVENIVFICILLLIGLVCGKIVESRHLKSIKKRELELNRMKHNAKGAKADYIFNVKYHTATIQQSGRGSGAIEVFAYGTALIPISQPTSSTNLT